MGLIWIKSLPCSFWVAPLHKVIFLPPTNRRRVFLKVFQEKFVMHTLANWGYTNKVRSRPTSILFIGWRGNSRNKCCSTNSSKPEPPLFSQKSSSLSIGSVLEKENGSLFSAKKPLKLNFLLKRVWCKTQTNVGTPTRKENIWNSYIWSSHFFWLINCFRASRGCGD